MNHMRSIWFMEPLPAAMEEKFMNAIEPSVMENEPAIADDGADLGNVVTELTVPVEQH